MTVSFLSVLFCADIARSGPKSEMFLHFQTLTAEASFDHPPPSIPDGLPPSLLLGASDGDRAEGSTSGGYAHHIARAAAGRILGEGFWDEIGLEKINELIEFWVDNLCLRIVRHSFRSLIGIKKIHFLVERPVFNREGREALPR